jgi:hypothetical protein
MLLRSVIAHVREQNWTAIAIDFVIVVVGVFVGLQVSNWNESRNESLRAQAYLERIEGDLADDIEELGKRREFWAQVIAHGHGAIAYAESRAKIADSEWKTLLAFYQASQLYPFVPADTTYQELRSAGELGLLRDQALRKALADYYVAGAGYAANFLFRTEPEYRKLVRGLTPALASRHVWSRCHSTLATGGGQVLLDCASPMSEPDALAVLDGYMSDPRLLPELRFWITNLEVMSSLVGDHETGARVLAARIREAIER